MGVVDEAVEDGVGIGWVADDLVPFIDRDLAGQNGRAAAISFFEDLVEITASATVERFEAPIIEDEKLDAVEAAHDAGVAAVAVGQREIGEELGNALIEDRTVVAAGLVAEGTGKPTFADAGWSAQDQIVMRVDPLAAGELVEQPAIEAARGPVIDVLDDGLVAQSGIAQPGGEAFVATMGYLAIDEQTEPVGVGEGCAFTGGFEFGESLGHAGKPELGHLIEHRMGQQCPFSLTG